MAGACFPIRLLTIFAHTAERRYSRCDVKTSMQFFRLALNVSLNVECRPMAIKEH
jgi:hypothetical protein